MGVVYVGGQEGRRPNVKDTARSPGHYILTPQLYERVSPVTCHGAIVQLSCFMVGSSIDVLVANIVKVKI